MNYKDITDKQIVDFLTKLKSKPKDDRQDYYDDHLDIARAYLAKIYNGWKRNSISKGWNIC